MITPDWTILVAAVVFLLTAIILNQFLFKPISLVLEERRSRTTGLREKARKILQQYEDSFRNYQIKIKDEKRRGYKLAEAARKDSLQEREGALSKARAKAEAYRREARGELEAELEAARSGLESEAGQLSRLIAARVLQREV